MDDTQEQDQYEERLKEVFNSFDANGCGSLSQEELSDLCQSLQLEDATPALFDTLLQNQDNLSARVDFDQFKNALILVLSSSFEAPEAEQQKPVSPEIQPKFVKGSKRYGRRSTPEFTEPIPNLSEVANSSLLVDEDLEDNYDSAVPRKRERWNAHRTSTEEYEAEGQMHLWNPDEPSTPCRSIVAVTTHLEEKLHEACEELGISWDGCVGHTEVLALCEHLHLEVNGDVLLDLNGDGVMNVQDFVSRVVSHNKPPTPSASTPYRQLKRHHSTQPFDEGGRRIATPSALTSTIGMRLFSTLDDGTGFSPVEYILDAWMEEGIENSTEILQALNFSLDGKVSLGDLTMALENELLITKNGIHQAALASFKAEIRYLLERVDRELREKEKIRTDLEKAEKLKTQLATEVDEHHSAIEQRNSLNIRKLEQDHREKLAAVRSELMKEINHIQQQAVLQREELEAEIDKIREDESFLRDHLSISVKENRRLEMELLDSTEKLVEAESQITKLQTSLTTIMKEKFGDLDPGSADFFLQEERIKQLRSSYEAQCRELQDRIDELQSELQEFHSLGRVNQSCNRPLSEELESKSPGMESDPGIGSEDVQPFSMSLEAEMMLEQLKEQHLHEIEGLRNQLESKIKEFDKMVEKQRATHEDQKAALALQYQQEVQALREEMVSVQSHAQELECQLEEAVLERKEAEQKDGLQTLQEEEVVTLRQQLQEVHTYSADLVEQLGTLEAQKAEVDKNLLTKMEDLKHQHTIEIKKLEEDHLKLYENRLEEEKKKLLEEKTELERRLLQDFKMEKELLLQQHENRLRVELEEAKVRCEEEHNNTVKSLTEQWEKKRAQMDEQSQESLQILLEEEMLRLVREQEDKESKLRKQWEIERAQLQHHHEEALLCRVVEETLQYEQRDKRLKEECQKEKLQLEEDYEGMLQDRLREEREKFEAEKEELEKRLKNEMAEEKVRLEESHKEVIKGLVAKHAEERDALSSTLEKLREDIAEKRRELEMSFTQRIKEVEDRFSGDQESVAERFQADVLKLEQHYQCELKALSESHVEQQHHWEAQIKMALENGVEQRRKMEEDMERDRECQKEEWAKERHGLENGHKAEVEKLTIMNKQLQNELEYFIGMAQTKEIELSRQLNDLHNRLQESLETKDELMAQSESKVLQTELLLNQTVEDFKQEMAELLNSHSELEAKYNEVLQISDGQITERIALLTERDDLKIKIEELEVLLKQAAFDFKVEKEKLQNNECIFEKLKYNLETEREELITEIDQLRSRIKDLELQLGNQVLVSNKLGTTLGEVQNNRECGSFSGEKKTSSAPKICLNNVVTVTKTSEEKGCISSFLNELNDYAESGTHTPDGGIPKVIINNEVLSKEIPASNLKYDRPETKMVDTENQEQNIMTENIDTCGGKEAEDQDVSCSAGTEHCHEDEPELNQKNAKNKKEAVSSSLEFKGEDTCGNEMVLEPCEKESKPQHLPSGDTESPFVEDDKCLEYVVALSVLEETGDLPLEDTEVYCLPDSSYDQGKESDFLSDLDCQNVPVTIKKENGDCAQDCLGYLYEDDCSLLKLQALFSTAKEENILLQEKIALLQQKSEILQNLLAHNSEKIKTSHQVLEENYTLKVKVLLLMEHVKELETKALKMADLQIRYEDCMCENAKLKDQNDELERRVWSLESRTIFPDFHVEIGSLREKNSKLLEFLCQLEKQDDDFSAVHTGHEQLEEDLLDLTSQPDVTLQLENDLEDCCVEFEKRNTKLRRAIAELQDKSQTINETTEVHRAEISRLAEENIFLREKIAALKEEDLKEEQLIQTLEHLKKEKIAAQKAAENFKQQLSEMRLQSQQHEEENEMLSEKNAQNIAEMERLCQQLVKLVKENERRELFPTEEKNKLAACVSSLEAELTKALKDTAQLEERNIQLSQQLSGLKEKVLKVESQEVQLSHLVEERNNMEKETQGLRNQLSKAQERVKTADETLQAVIHQSSRLKTDLRVLQQEKDSLKHEVAVLHKQLQNANDKNNILEMALHSSGVQNHSKKLYREEVSRLMEQEQEQQLLRQENERLQAEVHSIKGDLIQSREKVHQLDATILSLKQHKRKSQSSLVKALEQENAFLKQEIEAQKELTKSNEAGLGHSEVENLQQENESLKAQVARLSMQLLETFPAQLVGLLPPSPHRIPRGHRAEDPENVQDDRERKMKIMEERMREIELSLRNVKLLLKEKVAHLKDQLHKNSKADLLINELYKENGQLLKALERTRQNAEKKNYLLEEKISSLNKIVRDLNPSPLSTLSYHFKSS